MIYEIALLPIHKEHIEPFTRAFADHEPLLKRAKGYGGHMLAPGAAFAGRCLKGLLTPQFNHKRNIISLWFSHNPNTSLPCAG